MNIPMFIFFFLFVLILLLSLSVIFLHKEFILAKEMNGIYTAWENLLKNIIIWFVFAVTYAIFFAYSVTHKYSIEYIPISLFIIFLFVKSIYQKYTGGITVLNCGLPSNSREIILGQIFFLVLSITQIIRSQIGLSKGLFPTHATTILLLSIYSLLSNSQNIELKSKGISLVYRFLKWKDIKHYHLKPSISKRSGHVIFKIKKGFPLESEYRNVEVSERDWHNACEVLEQYLPNKRV
jgi:hypothetical protein